MLWVVCVVFFCCCVCGFFCCVCVFFLFFFSSAIFKLHYVSSVLSTWAGFKSVLTVQRVTVCSRNVQPKKRLMQLLLL